MRAVLRGERPVIRSDGSLVRDYLYVEDAVDGYLRFAEALAQRPELQGEALNLSTGIPATVLEVVERILSLAGSELTPEILNHASHEIPAQHLSAARALELLGWQARVGLDEGLTRTLAWYREFLHE
jgi:CDP-glucose 4,6-dehydratase